MIDKIFTNREKRVGMCICCKCMTLTYVKGYTKLEGLLGTR
jgi:hypothetical protein